jgi:DNA repair protein RadC
MEIDALPAHERPRERLLRHGPGALTDAELLAVCLGTGTRGLPVLALARTLLERYAGLHGVLTAPPPELVALPGLGRAKYCLLAAALELARRVAEEPLTRGATLAHPRAGANYLRTRLRASAYEVFVAVFLDNRHRVLACEELFRGTLDGASVHPREVVRRALVHNAAALVVAHNHPSGVAEPSQADVAITRRLRDALALVEIRLLDHFVVGEGEPVSLAERGLL